MRAALLATMAVLTVAPAALAQTASNNQYQAHGAVAQTNVAAGDVGDAAATAVAGGNAYAVDSSGSDIEADNAQQMNGAASADANAAVNNSWGNEAVASAAVGNGFTANSTNGSITLRSFQADNGDTHAGTLLDSGDAANASVTSSAGANVSALAADTGDVNAAIEQESNGRVEAGARGSNSGLYGDTAAASIASANNVTASGYTTTSTTHTTQRANGEYVRADVDLYAGSAANASGNATANGNAATIDNQFGYTNARVDQQSSGHINANAYVTLGNDFAGFASAGAYGVGNSATVSNSGSDTVIDTNQQNGGYIEANSAVGGDGGGAALSSSAAFGNSVNGALCSSCANGGTPQMTANNQQVNDGDVYASSRASSAYSGTIATTSTAIGNAATYAVRDP